MKPPRGPIDPKTGLSPQLALFVEEYFVDFNARSAAVRAKFAPATAKAQSYRIIRYPAVAAEIKRRMAKVRKVVGMGVDETIVRMSEIARDEETPVPQKIRALHLMMQHLRLMPVGGKDTDEQGKKDTLLDMHLRMQKQDWKERVKREEREEREERERREREGGKEVVEGWK
jgi:phage terminase small subunit